MLSTVSAMADTCSYHYEDPACLQRTANTIYSFIVDINRDLSREILYLCIGTDRATGDCLGPLVGTRLLSYSSKINLLGTLETPVHANNLNDFIQRINCHYENSIIVAVDACLGNASRIGFINIKEGGLKPGTALKKILPEVGDFHISGIVNVGGFLEQMVLQNTRLHVVYRMADMIARSIYLAQLRINQMKINSAGNINVCDY